MLIEPIREYLVINVSELFSNSKVVIFDLYKYG